jgi:hypothetical protein
VINLVLWVGGVVLLILGIARAAGPFGRMQELDRLADNAKRYDSWRGGSHLTAADNDRTGADEMREMMRRKTFTWAAVAVVGIVFIVAGFAIK